jgi:hypothetical protein
MSYTPMINTTLPRGSYAPNEYEANTYKPPNPSYNPYPSTGQPIYPQASHSLALFHIPSDGTNSLYVDGVPSDTSEREVSRT